MLQWTVELKVDLTSFSHVLILSFKTHRFRIVKFQKVGITIRKTFHSDDFALVNMQPYTVCPTRYRTRHFFNNSNINEDIATWPLPAHVMMSYFLQNEVSPLQISLQYPH